MIGVFLLRKNHHDNHHRFTLREFVMDLFDKLNDQNYQNMKFLDEFRYILVSSQLLDETILISKFKKKSLMDLNQKRISKIWSSNQNQFKLSNKFNHFNNKHFENHQCFKLSSKKSI